jgi:hypothetical protein
MLAMRPKIFKKVLLKNLSGKWAIILYLYRMAEIALIFDLNGYEGELFIRWMEVDNPSKVIGISKPLPFGPQRYAIKDINPVMHIVQMWVGGDDSGVRELIHQFEVMPNCRVAPGKVKINGEILVKALTGDLMTCN